METNIKHKNKHGDARRASLQKTPKQCNRRTFLQLCGSLIAGTAIAAISGLLLYRKQTSTEITCIENNRPVDKTACAGCKVNCPLRKSIPF